MAVTGQRANMCHFVSYIMQFQKSIVYNIPAVGEENLLAYCDLMSFELSLYCNFKSYCANTKLYLNSYLSTR